MLLTKLVLENFKKVARVEINLAGLNVLVGGNNAGKSSVLQGIHFSIAAAIASRIAGKDTYPQESLLYCPARNFEALRHGSAYANQSHFSHLKISARFPDDENESTHEVRIYRGRNEGNVGCVRTSAPRIGLAASSSDNLFSIYVPGLAGVPQAEQFRTESVVRRGVASGDANLYLRNVLLLIQRNDHLPVLIERMRALFPQFNISIEFNQKHDIYLNVQISTTGPHGRHCPLELVGTGVLQALQIFAYVTLFEPKLLLLDEPDSHLHPDNQALLASALQYIASSTATKVIVSTHSRHLVDALYEQSNFVWLKEGRVFEQGVALNVLPMLMDIGALDSFDRLMAGAIRSVFLTEDRNTSMLKTLVIHSGFQEPETLFFSYKTSSNLESALILADFIKGIAPTTNIIIHRDRDFLTDQEVAIVRQKIETSSATCFITEGSDIETYFISPNHLATLLQVDQQAIVDWLNEMATAHHNELAHAFTRKRDEAKQLLHRANPNNCPATLTLLGNAIPLPPENRRGKDMLSLIRGASQQKFGISPNVTAPTVHVQSPQLIALRQALVPGV
jgi:ABC-type dipeptide/oligopeptide/nickel transport system ATPase component